MQMLNSQTVMINTAIILTTRVLNPNFENELYLEFLGLLKKMPNNENYKDWITHIQKLHQNWNKNKLNTIYILDKEQIQWLEKKMNWSRTNKKEEEIEEINIIIRQLINKLQFEEKPIIYDIHYVKIENKKNLLKKILSLAFINEAQLQKLRNIKTENRSLNEAMDIFFKLINFKIKSRDHGWYQEWLWQEYINLQRKPKEKENQSKDENVTKELIEELEKIEAENNEIKLITEEERILRKEEESLKIKELENKYIKDEKEFSTEEIETGWKNEYINAKLASNLYRKAKKIIGNLQNEN